MHETIGSGGLAADSVAVRLRKARENSGMSMRTLSEKAGLSPGTAQSIESGTTPSIATIERLARALRVSCSWLAFGEGPFDRPNENCLVLPNVSLLARMQMLETLLQGCGGHIDHSYLYLDAKGAAAWQTLVNQSDLSESQKGIPTHTMAEQIAALVASDLGVLALGSGTAKHEVALVRVLARRCAVPIHLYLLDISPVLLTEALRYSLQTFSAIPGVSVSGILGDLYQMADCHELLLKPRRQRLATLLGYTLGNMDNEVRFLQNSLSVFAPDDLLLLDVTLARGPISQPTEILKNDPALRKNRPHEYWHLAVDFLLGPIVRHAQGVRNIKLEPRLDLDSATVPGSYAVDTRAIFQQDGVAKDFSVGYVKRYEPDKLADVVERSGWKLVHRELYAEEFQPARLMLFRKMRQPAAPASRRRKTSDH